ncbi:hypothetical protein [Pedobacter sandarakinus]|uniref:hypothetical protein n=1 Tax=Pedobacter sandarakinus TaxID=353156 RepID=UPI002246DE44|nr:hypothetical protein [Pedobacter sandarakinus]MCX2575030.1 hypothetical protein [Pedobacter sandarakinus]
MGKFFLFCFTLCAFNLLSYGQVGCRDNTTGRVYTNQNGGSSNWAKNPSLDPAPAGCSYPQTGGTCNISGVGSGILVSTTLECPLDASYFFLGFGVLLTLFSARKISIR